MLGNSSGSWQRRLTSSEAGSPAKQTGGLGHPRNWRCGCKPGILGPPKSPIPPLLRSAVELTATGPPTTWKLSHQHNQTTLAMKWKTNPGQPSNPLLLFPPAILTATSMLSAEPTSWSLEHLDDTLLCQITWSTATAAPAATAVPPSPPPSRLDDSGYASPVPSPIPFNLPREDATGLLSSPVTSTTTKDAATETTPPLVHSSTSQTPPPTKVVNAGVQSSPSTQTKTLDAATNTTSPTVTSCCSQTTQPATTDSCLQTVQPEPPITVTTTSPAAKKPKKRRKPKTSPPSTSPPSTTDAGTSYDPPPTVIPRWCRLCSSPILPDTKPHSHLITCDGLPELVGAECEGLLYDWSETFGLSVDTLAIITELILTTFDPGLPDPSTTAFTSKDSLISKLIPRSCSTAYEKLPLFWSNLNALSTSLDAACRKLLSLPPSDPLSAMFSNIDPDINEPTDVDEEDLAEYVAHHPLDLLDDLHDPSDGESEDYDCYEY